MSRILGNLAPEKVWYYFEEITKYPRPSKKEEKIAAYIKGWAKDKGFEIQEDEIGNFVVRKPATAGMEDRKVVCIQGHIDMVCEKNADVEFDFDNDAIQPYIDGDWVKAKGTTLGADNGVGVAMGMALLDSTDIPHPALELLLTLDEETGLTGAIQLGTNLLKSDILINLDSEEDGTFTIGCAGGMNTLGIYPYTAETVPSEYTAYKLSITNLRGGHSGINIHEGRGNAAKFMSRLLFVLQENIDFRLSDFNSGSKHNAIPREAFVNLVVANKQVNEFEQAVKQFSETLTSEYSSVEPGVKVEYATSNMPSRVLSLQSQKNIINSFNAIHHGVYRMSPDIDGLVQTSSNFAIVETKESTIEVLTSQRSSMESEKIDMAGKIKSAMELGGAKVSGGAGYPAWQPNIHSPILEHAKGIYAKMFGNEPEILVIHAGLECGLIGEKYLGMDMLSFGPTLEDVHSPQEKVSISSTNKTWEFLVEVIKNTPKK
ncbi:MAG TPA: aminoacyl-histidine dipeptidase [Candidatus Kapabacteria bacterium]|nr:aminoacyl-histidine dipeptidase [Candidatus Kapabacteria bacterium]